MEGRCERHLFDRAIDLCGRCGGEYCTDCLVYPFGASKPPFCLPCAVARGGVRSNAPTYQALSGRKLRQLQKHRKQALVAAQAAQAAQAAESGVPTEPDQLAPDAAFVVEPVPPAYEWYPAAEPA